MPLCVRMSWRYNRHVVCDAGPESGVWIRYIKVNNAVVNSVRAPTAPSSPSVVSMPAQHTSSAKLWQRLSGPRLMTLITAVSACAIAYEGMSQGVIGAVNSTPEFIHRMGYGTRDGRVTDPTKQGGIASIYYAGSLLGAFWAGQFADRYGRKSCQRARHFPVLDAYDAAGIKGLWMASLWCMTGVILQAAATDLAFILVARIIAGVGVAFLIVIAPLWTAELSPAAHRGRVICLTL